MSSPKNIANILLNLPVKYREWLLENVAPETFKRWCNRQAIDNRKFSVRKHLNDLIDGKTELSDLAKFELTNR